jgi:golgin subfamily B member 1
VPPAPFEVPPTLRSLDTGTIRFGYVEAHYERLVAEALEQGTISDDERARLNAAAEALGLDPERAERLEAALRAAQATVVRDTLVDEEERISTSVLEAPRKSLMSLADSGGISGGVPTLPASAIPEEELHADYALREDDGDLDGQWCTAAVLVHRGQATPEQEAFFTAHRTGTPPKPQRALTPETWKLVFDPAEDPLTGEIFGLIARPALIARVAAMRADKTLRNLPATQLQDPQTSTVSAVRAIGWAAATLGMTAPPIYIDPSLDIALEFVATVPPATRVGAHFLLGQNTLTLAFQAGRHMSWYRQEHYVCTLVPTIDHLSDVFVAAVLLGAPEIDLRPEVRSRVSLIGEALVPMLEPAQLAALRSLAKRFLDAGGKTSLADWAKAAASTASRAGLLLCGDLETACSIVSKEIHGPERALDLEGFWASKQARAARRALGIEIGG